LRILRNDNQLVEPLADLERRSQLLDTNVTVIAEVAKRQQGGDLARDESQGHLLGVYLSDDSRDLVGDLQRDRSEGSWQSLSHRRDNLLRGVLDFGDSNIDRFADKENVGEVDNVVLAGSSTLYGESVRVSSPRLGLRNERPKTAKQIYDTPLVQNFGHHSRCDHPTFHLTKGGRDLQIGIDQALLERKNNSTPRRLQGEYSSFDRGPNLESLLRVLQANIGIVRWPDDSVD
jgi:hypothetical protein